MKNIGIILTAILLVGCTVTKPVEQSKAANEAGAFPDNYRNVVLADAKTSFFDPYSIRSAEITKPFLENHAILGHFWAVCVRANAKNRMGAYVGIKTEAYVFRHGSLLQKSTHPEDYCKGRSFTAFPEMESIK